MVFAFAENGTLRIHSSPSDATQQWEGIDVAGDVVHFYDENGIWLEPRFITPNRRGTLLRLLGWEKSGTYELVSSPNAQEDSFALALYETGTLEPNPWFATLADLKAALSKKGVVVELDAKKT